MTDEATRAERKLAELILIPIETWVVRQFARYCAWRNIGLLVNVGINQGDAAVRCTGRMVALHATIVAPRSAVAYGLSTAEEIRRRLNDGDAA